MRRGRHKQFFCHANSGPQAAMQKGISPEQGRTLADIGEGCDNRSRLRRGTFQAPDCYPGPSWLQKVESLFHVSQQFRGCDRSLSAALEKPICDAQRGCPRDGCSEGAVPCPESLYFNLARPVNAAGELPSSREGGRNLGTAGRSVRQNIF